MKKTKDKVKNVLRVVFNCSCGYVGVDYKELKPTKNTLSARARCPKCKKVENFIIIEK